MTQTHTPGPWEISKSGALPVYVAAKDGRWKDAPGTIIGTVGTINHGTGDFREDIANARLIAAAPDMLAALRELVELAEGFNDADHAEDGDEPIVAPILKRARAAIAKATS